MLKSIILRSVGVAVCLGMPVAMFAQEAKKEQRQPAKQDAAEKPKGAKKPDSGDKDEKPSGEGGGPGGPGGGSGRRGGRGGPGGGEGGESEKTAYDFSLPTTDGKSLPLSTYKGKVLLIVNIGRKSSYATQMDGLKKLAETYKEKDLVIIGVPSDEFGHAEPGTDEEVNKFYADAKEPFLIVQRSTLMGIHALPLYDYLTKEKSIQENGLHWNYTKYIVDRKGKAVLRFGPDTTLDSLEFLTALDQVIAGTWKPAAPKREGRGGDGGDGPPAF